MNYYVYYKLAPTRAEEMRAAVEALFATVERQFGIRGQWLRRCDDPTTYMEVYEGVNDAAGFEALLERETAPLGLERRTERFVCA